MSYKNEFSKRTAAEHTIEKMYQYTLAKKNLACGQFYDFLTLDYATLDELKRFNKGHEAIIGFQKALTTAADTYAELSQFQSSKFTDFCLDIFNDWIWDVACIQSENYTFQEMLTWYDLIYLDSQHEYNVLTTTIYNLAKDYFPKKDDIGDIREISQYMFELFTIEKEN